MERREGAPDICFSGVLFHYRKSRQSLHRASRFWITVHACDGPERVALESRGFGWLTDGYIAFWDATDAELTRLAQGRDRLWLQVWYEE
jgi:hypothetical protein